MGNINSPDCSNPFSFSSAWQRIPNLFCDKKEEENQRQAEIKIQSPLNLSLDKEKKSGRRENKITRGFIDFTVFPTSSFEEKKSSMIK